MKTQKCERTEVLLITLRLVSPYSHIPIPGILSSPALKYHTLKFVFRVLSVPAMTLLHYEFYNFQYLKLTNLGIEKGSRSQNLMLILV